MVASRAQLALWQTVTIDNDADPQLWRPEDPIYLHRLVVDRPVRGADVGSAILDWAGRRAANRGKTWPRLDAWTGNTSLREYYRPRGFQLVRTVHVLTLVSGALFQRKSKEAAGAGPIICESRNDNE